MKQVDMGRAKGFVGVAVAGLLVVLLVGVVLVVLGPPFVPGRCTEEERRVYAEFPQYGGIHGGPEVSLQSEACSFHYGTSSSQERVAGYYTEQLEARGWEVERSSHQTTVFDGEKRTFEEVAISARRDDYFYSVVFSSRSYYDPPRPGVNVIVDVFENEDALPPCGSEEKAVLAEFPHYGGRELGRNLGTSSERGRPRGFCGTVYPASGATEGQVLGYYEEKLTGRGWKVRRLPTDQGGRLEADREGLRYVVIYSRFPEKRATDVRVEVYSA